MDRPVCLIENTADGKFQVNTEATAILSRICQPVVVVAIVGLYRTGKSYLMNKLSGSQKGFDLGSTVQAQTKGIWMRCLPHPTREGHTLVLLDTEGLGDVEKGDKKNDTWIFCLSVLLSSALVYNSKAVIDEDAVEKLHYVGEMAELIKVKSKDNDDDEAEYSSHFPIFIWAVRDVTLKLEFNGKPISEDEYLENALMLHKADNTQESLEKVERHNRYRDCIRMYFKSRKCFMFDLPTGNKEVLQNMDNVSDDQLSPAFVDQTKKFCDYVYNKAEVKYVDDTHKVTGESLATLATMYTNAISSSNAACMEDVVSNISVAENTAAVKEATQHYETRMKEKVTFPTETLGQIIDLSEECEKEALKIFIKRSFKDNEHKFHQQYMGIIEHKKSEFFKWNDKESRTHCEDLIKSLSKDLEDSLQQGAYIKLGGYQMFKEEMERIEDQYKKEPRKGTKAEEVFQEFKKSKEMLSAVIMNHDKNLSDQQKKVEEEKANKEKLEQQRRMEERQRYEENKKLEHQRRIIEEHFRGVLEKEQNERRLLQERLEAVEQEKARERDMYRSQGQEEQAEMYQMQIDDTRARQEEAKSSGWGPLVVSGLTAAAMTFFPAPAVLAGAAIYGVSRML
ncbi:guanylate-binding protein 1-like isoform X2 [Hyla sarda]|uniref:guanylate-binding protein 1-like isoform X2 n=1 Tax=Hyla sarda TaxID=327740 RepID=UPI0024C36DD7|nr:guanylate-binding protein 1-like isoform X2 [Hyla sarda]